MILICSLTWRAPGFPRLQIIQQLISFPSKSEHFIHSNNGGQQILLLSGKKAPRCPAPPQLQSQANAPWRFDKDAAIDQDVFHRIVVWQEERPAADQCRSLSLSIYSTRWRGCWSFIGRVLVVQRWRCYAIYSRSNAREEEEVYHRPPRRQRRATLSSA